MRGCAMSASWMGGSRRGARPTRPWKVARFTLPRPISSSPGVTCPSLTPMPQPSVAREGILLDARAGERYRGETEPIDPRAGHIPGAISAPTQDNLGDEGTFLPSDALRSRFAALGVDGSRPVAVYCGSGVSAAQEIVALAEAGFGAALYPGSWSQWSNDAERSVATGRRARRRFPRIGSRQSRDENALFKDAIALTDRHRWWPSKFGRGLARCRPRRTRCPMSTRTRPRCARRRSPR